MLYQNFPRVLALSCLCLLRLFWHFFLLEAVPIVGHEQLKQLSLLALLLISIIYYVVLLTSLVNKKSSWLSCSCNPGARKLNLSLRRNKARIIQNVVNILNLADKMIYTYICTDNTYSVYKSKSKSIFELDTE